MTISEAFELYRLDCIAFKGQSKKTEESHLVTLRSLVSFLGDIDIASLTFVMVRDWKAHLLKTCSPNTVRGYVIKLRVTLAYLTASGYHTLHPDTIPVPRRTDKVPSYITRQQVAAMIDCSRRLRSKAVISLLYSSGIRVNELINLDRGDIKGSTFTIIGKGGKARLCFIDSRTESLLGAYLSLREDNHPSLFLSTQSTSRMTATNVQLLVNNARQNAGIKERVTPHTLRHSFATDLLDSNTNLRHIQVMLGHANISTTMMYTHVRDPDLEEIYRDKHKV